MNMTTNKMRIRLFVPLCAALLLSGCGSMSLENKRVDYKSDVVKMPSLEVPPDLTKPENEDQYAIPEAGKTVANYSDYAKNVTTGVAGTVLPENRKVQLMHSGRYRWLLVNERVEAVWPQIREFWQGRGFELKVDDPVAGIMETGWTENRANIPKTGLRSLLGKVIDNAYDSGTRDMYLTRIERSSDGSSTEIYVTQYGMEQVLTENRNDFRWVPRPSDPELETAMLQMLSARLVTGENAKGKVETVNQTDVAANAPRLEILQDGTKAILMPESFEQSWRRIGIALDHARISVDEKDRDKGLYSVGIDEERKKSGLARLAFWRKSTETVTRHYQLAIRETGQASEVKVKPGKDGSDTGAEALLDELLKQLGDQ